METIEGNRLIAEFIGVPKHNPDTRKGDWWEICDDTLYSTDELQYHSSWEWLMPVVEKIASDYHQISMIYDEGDQCVDINAYENGMLEERISERGLNMLNSLWLAIIEFIKWYNSKTQQHENAE